MTKKLVFTTDDLPPGLDERARRSLWLDIFVNTVVEADISFLPDRPMSVHFEFTQRGAVGVGKYDGTIASMRRNSAHDPADQQIFHLTFNTSAAPLHYDIRARQAELPTGAVMLFAPNRPNSFDMPEGSSWQGIQIPKDRLLARVPNADDLVCTRLPETPATRLFRRYVDMINGEAPFDDADLTEHVETTLIDLAVLVLGANRDDTELASKRGLRAARTRAIVAEINRNFADPTLSAAELSRRLALSPRYINELLQESGRSFAERVLELRLQKARDMLRAPAQDRLRVSEIAYACGFGDISYFNRCFRRRFGESPSHARHGSAGE